MYITEQRLKNEQSIYYRRGRGGWVEWCSESRDQAVDWSDDWSWHWDWPVSEGDAARRLEAPRSSWRARRAPPVSGWRRRRSPGATRDGCDRVGARAARSATAARRPRRAAVRCLGRWAPPGAAAAVLGRTTRSSAGWCGCGRDQAPWSTAAQGPALDWPQNSWRVRQYICMTGDRRSVLPRRRRSTPPAAASTSPGRRQMHHHLSADVARRTWLQLQTQHKQVIKVAYFDKGPHRQLVIPRNGEGIPPTLIHGSLGPHELALAPNDISVGSVLLQGSRTWPTNRQTCRHANRPHY